MARNWYLLLLTPALFGAVPQCGISQRSRAAAFYERGDLPGATAQLEAGLATCPEDTFLSFMLGNARFRAGSFDAAASAYRSFLRDRRADFEGRMSLGFTLHRLGDKRGAIEQWNQALVANPDSPFAHAALAVGLAETGDTDNAISQVIEAVRLDPRYADPSQLSLDIRWTPDVTQVLKAVQSLAAARK
jgi:tetratricopeptide (TPR) repeat protein